MIATNWVWHTCFWGSIVLALASTFMFGYTFKEEKVEPMIRKTLDENHKVYEEMQDVFTLMVNNTDTIMRFSHFLDGHDPSVEQVIFCPECAGPNSKDNYESEYDIDLPVKVTFEQLCEDSKEFQQAFSRMHTSLLNQQFALRLTLERLRNGQSVQ